MKWLKEIRKVGFADWFWFVFILKRNEFSHKLCILRYVNSGNDKIGMARLMRDRNRAHRIDLALTELN
jgi:hypothetical protein